MLSQSDIALLQLRRQQHLSTIRTHLYSFAQNIINILLHMGKQPGHVILLRKEMLTLFSLAGMLAEPRDKAVALTQQETASAYGKTVAAFAWNKAAAVYDPKGHQNLQVGVHLLCQSTIILDNIHRMQTQTVGGNAAVVNAVAEVSQQVQSQSSATNQLVTNLMKAQELQINKAFEDQQEMLECIQSNQMAQFDQQRTIAQQTFHCIAQIGSNYVHCMEAGARSKVTMNLAEVSKHMRELRECQQSKSEC